MDIPASTSPVPPTDKPSGAIPSGDAITSQYWIPPHIRLCSTATGAVVLDLLRNRYLGVGSKESDVLTRVDEMGRDHDSITEVLQPLSATDKALADALVKAGLLVSVRPADAALKMQSVDLNSVLTSVGHQVEVQVRIRLAHILNFLRACHWARTCVRSRTLYSVALELCGMKTVDDHEFPEQRAVELVCLFRRLRPLAFTAKDQCLFHALALVRFLAFYSVFPVWVVGVRTRPWAAHSWVQQGTLLLDSNPEHVCEYTPILSV